MAFNAQMFQGFYRSKSFDFVLFGGPIPNKTEMQNYSKARTDYTSLNRFVKDADLLDSPNLLSFISFPEPNPSIVDRTSFPKENVKLNKIVEPIFDFYNEGEATWFIFCAQTYFRSGYPLLKHFEDQVPGLMAIGEVGDLNSGKDLEMNQRFITSDIELRSSNLRFDFDRLIRIGE